MVLYGVHLAWKWDCLGGRTGLLNTSHSDQLTVSTYAHFQTGPK